MTLLWDQNTHKLTHCIHHEGGVCSIWIILMMFTAVFTLLTTRYIFCRVIIPTLLITALEATKVLYAIFNILMYETMFNVHIIPACTLQGWWMIVAITFGILGLLVIFVALYARENRLRWPRGTATASRHLLLESLQTKRPTNATSYN